MKRVSEEIVFCGDYYVSADFLEVVKEEVKNAAMREDRIEARKRAKERREKSAARKAARKEEIKWKIITLMMIMSPFLMWVHWALQEV